MKDVDGLIIYLHSLNVIILSEQSRYSTVSIIFFRGLDGPFQSFIMNTIYHVVGKKYKFYLTSSLSLLPNGNSTTNKSLKERIIKFLSLKPVRPILAY